MERWELYAHKAICWSKHDLLNESEIFDDQIIKTKNKKQNCTIEKQDNALNSYKFVTNEPHSEKRKLEKNNKQYMKSMKWSSLKNSFESNCHYKWIYTISTKGNIIEPKQLCIWCSTYNFIFNMEWKFWKMVWKLQKAWKSIFKCTALSICTLLIFLLKPCMITSVIFAGFQ